MSRNLCSCDLSKLKTKVSVNFSLILPSVVNTRTAVDGTNS